MREGTLSECGEDANPNVHGVAVQSFDLQLVHGFAFSNGVVRHFDHDPADLRHNPVALGSKHALLNIIWAAVKPFFPEELVRQLADAPLRAEPRQQVAEFSTGEIVKFQTVFTAGRCRYIRTQ